jgi:uncharacterized membrane protein
MPYARIGSSLALASLIALAACGGDGDDGPSGSNSGTIQVSVNPTALTIQQGGSGTVTVSLTRAGGFTGSADIAVEGLPAGVTAIVAPNPITGATTQAVVTVNASAAAATGTSTVTVRASAAGLTSVTTTYQLTVNAAPAYTIAAGPNAVTVQQGASGGSTITITRSNFAGVVNLTLQNPPTGVTGTFTPSAANGTTSTLGIAVGGTVAPGPYTLTVLGTAAGLADRTTTITLTVAAAQAPAYTLALNPATLTIAQGGNSVSTITTTKTGGFTGAVTLALEGAPAGVTGTFTPATAGEVSGNGQALETATLTVNVGTGVVAGNYNLVVRGTAAALADRTAPLVLTVNAAAGYTLSVAQTPVSIQAGQSGNATVTVNRTGGFGGTVNLTLEGAPAGITGAFTPAAVTGNTSTLALTVAGNVAAGTYNLTVRGTATGQTDQTVALAVTVTAQQSAIALTIAPTTLSVAQGGSSQTTATITRTNFTANVTFTATGAPNGVTVTPNPGTTTTNASTITVAVGAAVTPGTYPLVVRANGTGVAEATAQLSLTVTATSGGGAYVEAFCNADPTEVPIWFAVQDGNGAWTRVNPQVAGNETQFRFDIASSTAGIAYVMQSGSPVIVAAEGISLRRNQAAALRRTLADATNTLRTRTFAATAAFAYQTVIEYRAKSEFATSGGLSCATDVGTRTLNGSITGASAGQTVVVSAPGDDASIQGGVQSNFQLTTVRTTGAIDVIATRSAFDLVTFQQSADRVIFRRNINPASGSTLPAFDFNAAEAIATVKRSLTVGNLSGDTWAASADVVTSRGATASLGTVLGTTGNTGQWTGLPLASLVANEVQALSVIAVNPTQGAEESRFVSMLSTDAVDRTITLGERVPLPAITVIPTPYARPNASGARSVDYRGILIVDYTQPNSGRFAQISATEAWLTAVGQVATYTLPFPDFSAVSGWQNDWGLKTGQSTSIIVAQSGPEPQTVDGALFRFGYREVTQSW